MNRTRRHEKIGNQRPSLARRGKLDILSISRDSAEAQEMHFDSAGLPDGIVGAVGGSPVPDKFLAISHGFSHAESHATI